MLEQTVELPRAVAAEIRCGRRPHARPGRADRRRRRRAPFGSTIAQPLATTASDPAQLLNVLYGNCSLQPDVVLADVDLPAAAFDWLPGPRPASRGCARSPASRAGRCWRPRSSRWGSRPAQLAALCAHVRSGRSRHRQGRPRPRRPSVLPLRGAGRGLSPRGGRRGPRHRPARAVRAQPHRHAGPDRRQLAFAARGRAWARSMLSPDAGAACPRCAELASLGRRAADPGPPGVRRRAARARGGAVRQALPLVRRRRRHLPARRAADSATASRPAPRSAADAPRAASAGAARLSRARRRHQGRAGAGAALVLRTGLHPAHRQQSLRGGRCALRADPRAGRPAWRARHRGTGG